MYCSQMLILQLFRYNTVLVYACCLPYITLPPKTLCSLLHPAKSTVP